MYLHRKLLTQAFNSAKARGHIIQWNNSALSEYDKEQYGSCINPGCSAWIVVNCKTPTGLTILPSPLPSQMKGPAVTLNCPAAEEDCC